MNNHRLLWAGAAMLTATAITLAQENPPPPQATEQAMEVQQTPAASPEGEVSAPAAVAPVPAPPAPTPPPPAPSDIAPGAAPALAPVPPTPRISAPKPPGAPPAASNQPGVRRSLRTIVERTVSSEEGSEDVTESTLANGLIDEERDLSPNKAIGRYQAIIARFDQQRASTAQAIFRLGECYRKLGRVEEAKAQYGRILREFSDQAALVQASQRHLFGPVPSSGSRAETVARLKQIESNTSSRSKNANVNVDLDDESGPRQEEVETRFDSYVTVKNPTDGDLAALQTQIKALEEQRRALSSARETGKSLEEKLRSDDDRAPLRALGEREAMLKMKMDDLSGMKNQDLRDAQAELDLAKANLRTNTRLLKETEKKMMALQESDPANLPLPASADNRYMQLRSDYANAITLAADNDAGKEVVEKRQLMALEKLLGYVKKMYIPEVKASLDFTRKQVDLAKKEVAEAQAKVEDVKASLEKKLQTQMDSLKKEKTIVKEKSEKVF